ncbi:hypothetical protein QJS10_CPB04g01500 [Acorus calamus]|uniref:Uncharacterized protein n=1 Tax=Acorus calamus TaxID=4465 RepID=A0AAV9F335_ACOCL|nr:hypothetical protein QJS10_CPB04g01500 [Acorus calamus]
MRTDAEEIDRLARRFLWAGGRTERVIHYINWERVTSEKAAGGLGIRRTPILRAASLAIMAYRVLLRPSMVQQVFGLKYKWSGNPWELPRAQRSSRNWRRLCEGHTLIRQHSSLPEVRIGDHEWWWELTPTTKPRVRDMYQLLLFA